MLLLSGLFSFAAVQAQESDEDTKRSLEREIKTSGLYLYGEAVADTKQEATKAAKTALITEINKEMVNHPEWQFAKTIQAKDIEYQTDLIDLMRGNKTRVIVYIRKENLTAVFSDETPDIKLTDKKEDKKNKKQTAQTPAAPETEQPATADSALVETAAPAKTPEQATLPEGSDLLKSILSAVSAQQVNKILLENKANGKAVYGKMETLQQPGEAYIVVYTKTGELVAILDKGTEAVRKDLISGEMKDTNSLYKETRQTWFKLF
jgi:hypothetical protein